MKRRRAMKSTTPGTITDPALPHVDFDDTPAGRLLTTAREVLLREGYSALTMDALSSALGVSKKTLYVSFASKDDMVKAIFAATGATIRQRVAEILAQPGGFIDKLNQTLRLIGTHFGSLSPRFLADLQRYAPQLSEEIDAVMAKNIPQGLAPILKLGVKEGLVRNDEDVPFLIEYWLLVARGLHDPARLARLGSDAEEAFRRAIDLFLGGILTSSGRARLRGSQR